MAPLVFLPGAGGSASFWRPVADRLRDLGEVHVLGYPGFGGVAADPGVKSLDDLYRWVVERLPPGSSQRIAGARVVSVAGGTHSFASERPDEVASIIRFHLV